ncbi:hypothetical protein IFM47457_11005 [Aspergillus lentulus]|nr:hypothetical protein IFM47457_11005 [Aspergillus lentulus]
MRVRYDRVITSGVTPFCVGKSHKRFLVHTSLVEAFPKSITQNVKDGAATIEDVDEDAFSRACEFAYTGDYSVPLPVPVSPRAQRDHDDNNAPAERGAKRWNSENLLQNLFHPLKFPALSRTIEEKLEEISAVYMPYPNDDPLEDHSEIFLTHARVYRFSNRAGWISLNTLAFYNLAHTLHDFTLFEERVTDIVGLLSFVFEESEYMESLQHLLRNYAVWHVETLMQNAAFRGLLERRPQLEKYIFRAMWDDNGAVL